MNPARSSGRWRRALPEAGLPAVAALAVLIALALWGAWRALEPTPEKRLVIATGPGQGACEAWGQRYAPLLQAHGLAVAAGHYRSGPPWLQRYLPFWLANFVDRMWIVLLPLLAALRPLSRTVPPLVTLRLRSRIYRWYADLRAIEQALDTPARPTCRRCATRSSGWTRRPSASACRCPSPASCTTCGPISTSCAGASRTGPAPRIAHWPGTRETKAWTPA